MPDISRWLIDNGLGQYETTFIENDIDLGVLPDLTEADLERLGLTLGHRKKLLRAASLLQASSEGAKNAAKNVSSTPSVRPEAERRHLTVMFCDLVGSTALSAKIDPEEMRDVLRSFQNAVAGEIGRYDGHLAKFMATASLPISGGRVPMRTTQSERSVVLSRQSKRLAGCATHQVFPLLREPELPRDWWSSETSSARGRLKRKEFRARRQISPPGFSQSPNQELSCSAR